MFFTHSLRFPRPQELSRAGCLSLCLSVCLAGTRLLQVAHMSSASRSHTSGSVIDPNQMLTGKKRALHNPGQALFSDPSFNTSSGLVQHSGCCALVGCSQTEQGVHNLVRHTQWVTKGFVALMGRSNTFNHTHTSRRQIGQPHTVTHTHIHWRVVRFIPSGCLVLYFLLISSEWSSLQNVF